MPASPGFWCGTGKVRASDLNGAKGRPDHVVESIGALPELLEGL
jgi:hypothetical protein